MNAKKEIVLYVITGGVTTVIAWASYLAATRALGLHYLAANVISFVLCNLFSFTANKLLVFRKRDGGVKVILKEAAGFLGCRGVSFLADTLILFLGVACLRQNDIAVKIVSSFFVMTINYIGNKKFVFRKSC